MVTPHAGLIVVLNADADADTVAGAIRQLRGVDAVHDVSADADADLIRESVNAEWRQRIVDLLDDEGV